MSKNGPENDSSPRRDVYSRALHGSVGEVHRDDALWVLDKPAGILSHPNPPSVKSSSALFRGEYDHDAECYVIRERGVEVGRIWLVHRLDLDTSGLMLATFCPEAAARLKEDLFNRELDKEYRALLLSAPRPPIGEWEDRLAKSTQGGRIEVRAKSGTKKNALTSYELLRTYPGTGIAMVSMRPHTGRTHQLRVQAAKHGVPVAGDERYGDFVANRFLRERIGLKYMFLHAWRLTLRHPRTGHRMTFQRDFSQRLSLPLEELETLQTRLPRSDKEKKAASGGGGRGRGASGGRGGGRGSGRGDGGRGGSGRGGSGRGGSGRGGSGRGGGGRGSGGRGRGGGGGGRGRGGGGGGRGRGGKRGGGRRG